MPYNQGKYFPWENKNRENRENRENKVLRKKNRENKIKKRENIAGKFFVFYGKNRENSCFWEKIWEKPYVRLIIPKINLKRLFYSENVKLNRFSLKTPPFWAPKLRN